MPELKQHVVLFIEPTDQADETPTNIGNLYMNRFAIEEDAACEIINIYKLHEKNHYPTKEEKEQKGTNLNRICQSII